MRRRSFLKSVSATALAAAAAKGGPGEGIRLGFDTYSVRAFKWKDLQLIEYAAGLKLDTLQLSSLGDYASLETAHLRKVRDHAERLGIALDGGIGCICPISKSWNAKEGTPQEYIVRGLTTCKAVGASVMRCFLGSQADRRSGRPLEEFIDATVKVLRSVRAQAQDLNVKIAVENHAGDMQAREVRTLIEGAGKDFVGSCLDTGNPMWVAENPLVTIEILGPYAVTTHVRDSAVFEHPRGAAAQWVALGDGNVDFPALLATYQRLCPKAAMQLEIITGRPPDILPYLEPDFWTLFPHTPAAEFAQFVKLAKSGHPFMGSMVIEDSAGPKPAEFQAALREQQKLDLERSLEYAKKTLGVGLKWKSPASD